MHWKSTVVGVLVLFMLGFGPLVLPPAAAQTSRQTTSQLYQLEFVQDSNCPYVDLLIPWAVVLDNSTVVVQPSNSTLPLTYEGSHFTSDSNYSTISFSVPNGTYNYTILPKDPFNREQSGNVTIDGGDVQVQVGEFVTAMGCSSTTTTTTSTASTVTATVVVAKTTTIVSTVSGTVTTITTTIPGTATTMTIPGTATTITSTSSTSSALLYGVTVVAVIFIVATAALAVRGRNPAPRS